MVSTNNNQGHKKYDKQNVPNQCKIIEVQLFKMFGSYLQLHMHFLHQNYSNLNTPMLKNMYRNVIPMGLNLA
jgi:hypothetical protein